MVGEDRWACIHIITNGRYRIQGLVVRGHNAWNLPVRVVQLTFGDRNCFLTYEPDCSSQMGVGIKGTDNARCSAAELMTPAFDYIQYTGMCVDGSCTRRSVGLITL